MKTLSTALFFGLCSATLFSAHASDRHDMANMQPTAATAEQHPVVNATGEVKHIDMQEKKITIAHGPVAALNWPAMTMRFTLTPTTHLQDIKPGDKVEFTFVQQGNISLLQDMHTQD